MEYGVKKFLIIMNAHLTTWKNFILLQRIQKNYLALSMKVNNAAYTVLTGQMNLKYTVMHRLKMPHFSKSFYFRAMLLRQNLAK